MKCPRCGNEQTDGAFCTKCGAPMNQNNGYNAPQQQQNNNHQQPNMNNGGYYQQQNTNYNGYGQPNQNMYQQPRKEKFYEKTWLIVLACIFLPPAGLALIWITGKPKNYKARCIISVILAIITVLLFFPDSDSKIKDNTAQEATTKENVTQQDDSSSNDDSATEEEQQEPNISPDEYKAQCQEVNYNDVMRSPDQYVGQKFKITVQIFSASSKWTTGTYYKAYTDNGSGSYFDKMVWIFDKRDENADGYTKVLEGDTVTFYGEFNGLQETKNALNGEKGEDFALDAYYVDIIQEAQ